MMAICFAMFLILCGLFYKKSKIVELLLLIFMWCFYALNTYSGDYISYEYVYSIIGSGSKWIYFEPGFTFIMLLCKTIGLSFTGFRIVLATFFTLFLDKTIRRYTNNVAFVLAIYMIFPFMYFASVLRGGIAGLIIVYSIYYLQTDETKGVVKYIIGVLIAMLFHTSSIFFLVFILSRGEVKKNIIITATFISMVIAILFSNSFLYRFMSLFTSNVKVLQWLNGKGNATSSLNLTGKLMQVIVLFSIIFITDWGCRIEKKICANNDISKMSSIVHKTNVYLLILVPMMMISDVWIRLVWEVLLLNICFYANVVDVMCRNSPDSKTTCSVSLFGISTVVISLLLLIYVDKPYWGTRNTALEMFYNNLLFKLLPF